MRHRVALSIVLVFGLLWVTGCAVPTPSGGVAQPAPECEAPCARPSAWYAGARVSYGPDLGGAVELGRVVTRTPKVTGAVEVRATYQFVDNTQALNLERDAAVTGWRQLEVGVKATFAPGASRHLTARVGLTTSDVHGNLNVVRETGRYYGAYLGLGFETDFGTRFSMGPSVQLNVMQHEEGGRLEFVPNVGWHATWKF